MTLNRIGVVDASHVLLRTVIHEAVAIIATKITVSVMTIATNGRSGFNIFTDDRL